MKRLSHSVFIRVYAKDKVINTQKALDFRDVPS
jgi:hypothetical protein